MSRATENAAFDCGQCGVRVRPLGNGSYRNHCPACLWSRHVDERPGDRASECGALMEPVAIEHRSGKGMVVVHQCVACGRRQPNRLATDDRRQPDDVAAIAAVSTKALPPHLP